MSGDPDAILYAIEDLVAVGDTHVGRVRTVNQDDYGEWSDAAVASHLIFVADGMGGHRGGEVASRLAVEQVGRVFGQGAEPGPGLLERTFERANREIFDTAHRDLELSGMGTTGVALVLNGTARGWVGHVGDSRAYRLRDGEFEQLTGDHSVVGELVRRGQLTSEEARIHPQSNEILRAIGTQPEVEVEISEIDIALGDRYLLCSDGLCGMLPDAEIAEVLASTAPEEAVGKLIDLANEAGGTDNITVQIAVIPDEGPDPARASGTQTDEDTGDAKDVTPGEEPLASGSMVRWAVAVALVLGLLLILFGGSDSSG